MSRSITAIPTTYAGVNFRSRLEASDMQPFLTLWAGGGEYEPSRDLKGWIPDFRLTIPCKHSECYGSHRAAGRGETSLQHRQLQWHPGVRAGHERLRSRRLAL